MNDTSRPQFAGWCLLCFAGVAALCWALQLSARAEGAAAGALPSVALEYQAIQANLDAGSNTVAITALEEMIRRDPSQ